MRKTGVLPLAALCLALHPADLPAGDGLAALRTGAPACVDASNALYVDCHNGTVTDNRTGLVWLADADCLGETVDWPSALWLVAGLSDNDAVEDCGLEDGSSPGEWRLPTIWEWYQMVLDAAALGCDPLLSNNRGDGCWSVACHALGECAFADVSLGEYWSATSSPSLSDRAYTLDLYKGPATAPEQESGPGPAATTIVILLREKSSAAWVWPVRDGQ